jgi:hypothetical protein
MSFFQMSRPVGFLRLSAKNLWRSSAIIGLFVADAVMTVAVRHNRRSDDTLADVP